MGLGLGVGVGVADGAGGGVGSGVGVAVGLGLGLEVGVGVADGAGGGVGSGVGVGASVGTGVGVGGSISSAESVADDAGACLAAAIENSAVVASRTTITIEATVTPDRSSRRRYRSLFHTAGSCRQLVWDGTRGTYLARIEADGVSVMSGIRNTSSGAGRRSCGKTIDQGSSARWFLKICPLVVGVPE